MDEALALLGIAVVALAIGTAIGFWLGRAAAGARVAVQENRATELQERLAATEETLARARSALTEAQTRVAQLDTALTHERRTADEKLTALTEAHERLATEFKALSADALRSNNTAFLQLARETFAKLQQESTGELDKRQVAIDSLVKPLKESLERVDARIGEIEKTRVSAYSALSEQLKALSLAQISLQTETTRLSTALSATRTAGTWGELQLRRVVELAGMVEHCDFTEQEVAGTQRPDLVVRLPRGQQIVVDAKAPTDAYREAAVATDPKIRAQRLAEHATRVRQHVEALAARAYWEQFQPSPEFVVLFLPGDQFLAAALEVEPALVDRAIRSRVLLATPSTLIALLKAAAYGWRQEALSQNAEAISQLGRELYNRIATFAENLDKVGRGLDAATKGYNAAVGSFEGSLLPGARRFAELGAKGTKDLVPPCEVDTLPRDVTKRE